jgi:hypothetical protein
MASGKSKSVKKSRATKGSTKFCSGDLVMNSRGHCLLLFEEGDEQRNLVMRMNTTRRLPFIGGAIGWDWLDEDEYKVQLNLPDLLTEVLVGR